LWQSGPSQGGMNDEGFDVADLKDDDDEPVLDVLGASQLHGASLPQTQTQEASDFSSPLQTHSLRASCSSSG
jgi:hypothetical protein